MEWTDSGFVVARGLFRESDIWLRVLFAGHGLQTVFAFGGARSRRRFVGCLDVLNVLRCRVAASRTGPYLELCEATLEQGPHALRHSPALLGLAMNCLKFAEAAGVPPASSPRAFRLLAGTLAVLDASSRPPALFSHFFQLSLAGILGYAPDFAACGQCGAAVAHGASFLVEEGRILCPECAAGAPSRGLALSAAALDVLRDVQQEYPASWPDGGLSPSDRRAVARAIASFVQFHLGLAWANGRYAHV